jgi:hypothetical protein
MTFHFSCNIFLMCFFIGIELNQPCHNSAHAHCGEWRYNVIQPEDTEIIIEIKLL